MSGPAQSNNASNKAGMNATIPTPNRSSSDELPEGFVFTVNIRLPRPTTSSLHQVDQQQAEPNDAVRYNRGAPTTHREFASTSRELFTEPAPANRRDDSCVRAMLAIARTHESSLPYGVNAPDHMQVMQNPPSPPPAVFDPYNQDDADFPFRDFLNGAGNDMQAQQIDLNNNEDHANVREVEDVPRIFDNIYETNLLDMFRGGIVRTSELRCMSRQEVCVVTTDLPGLLATWEKEWSCLNHVDKMINELRALPVTQDLDDLMEKLWRHRGVHEQHVARIERGLQLRIRKLELEDQPCMICLEEQSKDPVACVLCQKVVGCGECVQRWQVVTTKRLRCLRCNRYWGNGSGVPCKVRQSSG